MKPKQLSYLASFGFQEMTVSEIVENLSRIGYKGVGWTLAHFNPREKTEAELKKIVDITRESGMEIGEIVVQQDFVNRDNSVRKARIELVKESVAAAGELGLNVVNLFTGPAPWDENAPKLHQDIEEGEAWDLVLSSFSEIIPHAEEYEVYLAVEAVFGMTVRDYYTLKQLLDSFDSKYLAVNLDPSHYVLYRNDPAWATKQLEEKIKHVHLKDVIGVPGKAGKDFMFPLLGEGMINWQSFFDALDSVDYDGFLSVEFESFKYGRLILENDPIKIAELSMEQLKKLIF